MRKNPVVFTFRGDEELKSKLDRVCSEYDIKPAEFMNRAMQSKLDECFRDLLVNTSESKERGLP